MNKKWVILILAIVLSLNIFTGCSSQSHEDEYMTALPASAPICTSYFITKYNTMFYNAAWMPVAEDTTYLDNYPVWDENDALTEVGWDTLKEIPLGTMAGAIGRGIDAFDGLQILASIDEEADMSKDWGTALMTKNGFTAMFVFENHTNAAKKFFGELVVTNPKQAILDVCGDPSLDVSDENNLTYIYALYDNTIAITAYPDENAYGGYQMGILFSDSIVS